MARTNKDKARKYVYGDSYAYREEVSRWHWEYIKNARTKKKRSYNERSWMGSTPNWWISLFMTRPQRRAGAVWEQAVVRSQVDQLEELDTPNVSRKPHHYYW